MDCSFLTCPLCCGKQIFHFHTDNSRDYLRCRDCLLVFVPPDQRLDPEQEKAVYDNHENHIDDPAYRQFLSRLLTPLVDRLEPAAAGLDFGCGPGPALAAMFRELGFHMSIYDPVYCKRPEVLAQHYQFITCTEVVEHLFNPAEEFARLFQRLTPDGWLGIMTKLVRDEQSFGNWHYKNDPTHVCFYSRETFYWLAEQFQCLPEFIGNDVILLKKLHPG